ncbi:hypothetical protein PU629_18545 [Pullulanibacillus sp. KACC 23026]|uniref:hypothetical protein n=1 Tax=Pullulanibacillus sp. KACC 23026 TaxID=3028315 RepID=UPI0023B14473|nr:hypothetical protein [Pullulanibacillus sp. KACC 23026]WEG12098.1 hypothetical protein PU629_18545 [Pullulanibacillus sp. KACC 23026]
MKRWVSLVLALMIGLGMVPHSSEARSYSHSFSRHYSTPSRSYTNRGTSSFGRSFTSHAAAFGAGMLIGHMFHPFGGYYGGTMYGFSFTGILVDIILLLVIVWLIRRLFTRRR